MPTREQVDAALAEVQDPEIRRPITELGMVKDVRIDGGAVHVDVYLTVAGCPMRDEITGRVTRAVEAIDGVTPVTVDLDVMSDEQRKEMRAKLGGPEKEIQFTKPGIADPRLPDRLRQGRRRQVLDHREPGRVDGRAGAVGRASSTPTCTATASRGCST